MMIFVIKTVHHKLMYLLLSLQFSVTLVDGDGKASLTPLTCTYSVRRNNHSPVFVNLPAVQEVTSNLVQNIDIFDVDATDQDPSVSY